MSPDSSVLTATSRAPAPARLLHLDWLRVLAMGAIFLYHNLRPYDFDDWHIKNAVTSQPVSVLVEIGNLWMMPLFFVLSSAAIYYSLRSRTAGQFVKERFLRIAVPWLGLGMFVFGPLQMYLDRLSHGGFDGSFIQFMPHYFDGFYGINGNFAWMGVHLWYLMMLFLFIIIMLPFLLPLGRERKSLLSRLSPACRRPTVLILLFVPLALASILTDALGLYPLREFGSWDTFSYLLFFSYGYMLHADSSIQPTIDRLRRPALIVALALAVLIVAMEPSAAWYFSAVRAACAWSWVLAILGFGHALLNFTSSFVMTANEAVLPFYILHQPVIVVIAFFVVQLDAAPLLKYLLTVVTSFAIIVALYQYVVRPVGVLRFLFGMKPKAKSTASAG
jgi:glucan biosynthesis protein C